MDSDTPHLPNHPIFCTIPLLPKSQQIGRAEPPGLIPQEGLCEERLGLPGLQRETGWEKGAEVPSGGVEGHFGVLYSFP